MWGNAEQVFDCSVVVVELFIRLREWSEEM